MVEMLESFGRVSLHNWWAVVHVDKELGKYYRHLFNYHHRFKQYKVGETHWGPHISFIRDEKPPRLDVWEGLSGREIKFKYKNLVRTNGKHIWLDVICEEFFDIRKDLGLSYLLPNCHPHLTVGVYHKKTEDDDTTMQIHM